MISMTSKTKIIELQRIKSISNNKSHNTRKYSALFQKMASNSKKLIKKINRIKKTPKKTKKIMKIKNLPTLKFNKVN